MVLILDRAGALTLAWDLAGALVTLVAGVGLLTVAPASRAQYVGTLARITRDRGNLWALRAATVATAPLAGLGPAVYGLLTLRQALAPEPPAGDQPDGRRSAGTGLVGLSVVLAADAAGLTLGSDALLWGVLGGSAGLSLYWWGAKPMREGGRVAFLLLSGAVLLWLATVSIASSQGAGGTSVVVPAVAGAVLALLVLGPRWTRTQRELAAEREERARTMERSELAEKVHDSVLQTLALIQSRADDPAEVKALARSQERDLRERLFGERTEGPASVGTALRAVAAEVEDAYRVKVEVVIVGDAELDEPTAALVAAAREALANAAKHAGGAPVSLFAEINERQASAFVRDRGPGFDLEAVPADRRGVRDSIVARMVRHGGHAAVRTAPGGGCEVRLVQERRR